MRDALFGWRAISALVLGVLLLGTSSQPITFRAHDGVTVYGIYRQVSPSAPLILLFHQARSSKAEYATIAPVLNAHGYSTLAIDQRAGGSMYGTNQTMAHIDRPQPEAYLAALPDLEAALRWARTHHHGKIVIWGSSYSSSLVFLLASNNPDIAAVLAFSPGEYFSDKTIVHRAAAQLHMPIFVDSAADPQEISAARSILQAAPASVKVQYAPAIGIHGSSTLITKRDPRGAAANWSAVLAFLTSNVR
jgi:dienelactone hydrolase